MKKIYPQITQIYRIKNADEEMVTGNQNDLSVLNDTLSP
jgi:hypothetical protein